MLTLTRISVTEIFPGHSIQDTIDYRYDEMMNEFLIQIFTFDSNPIICHNPLHPSFNFPNQNMN
jgi:hypothetical protein